MNKATWLLVSVTSVVWMLGVEPAMASPTLRVKVTQRGDMAWIGNTSAQECDARARTPVVGIVGVCGMYTSDTAVDAFWTTSDDPSDPVPRAWNQVTAAQARSTAVLSIPADAEITYARLYWGAELSSNTPDQMVTLDRIRPDGTPVFTQTIQADKSYIVLKADTASVFWYESTADVTTLVHDNGIGPYRVSGIDSVELRGFQSETPYVAWSLVVFYKRASDPWRNLALFDGLDFVNKDSSPQVSIDGFLVPAAFDAKLGVMAFEGDIYFIGDSLIFNKNTLSDAVNPADNFFNGSRSWLGSPVSVAGDLPQMDGLAASMSGFDLDVVDVTPYVKAGDTSATIQATSNGDTYVLGAFATSITTYQPDFSQAVKSFADLNGGAIVRGDFVEYTIVVPNTGNDAALGVVLTDNLPAGVVYRPGTLHITDGPNAGTLTDAADADQGEYNATTRTITVRLGEGASATDGGSVPIEGSSTIKFQVMVDKNATGTISNQATTWASGLKGNPAAPYLTGNGTPGTVTSFPLGECDSNADCEQPRSRCDTLSYLCVQCLADSDCGGASSARVCDSSAKICIDGCRGSGGNTCPTGKLCTSDTTIIGRCFIPNSGAGGTGGADASIAADAPIGAGGAGGNGGIDGQMATGGADGGRYDAPLGIDGPRGIDGSILDGAVADTGPAEGDALALDVGRTADVGRTDVLRIDAGAIDTRAIDGGNTVSDAVVVVSPDAPVVNPDAGGSIQGGGCSCSTVGAVSSRPSGAWLVLLAVVVGAGLRRRKRTQ
jgi:uncharacterized repeat protein (TIGR01451 family)/MYXO-CTERM domain-containing protein